MDITIVTFADGYDTLFAIFDGHITASQLKTAILSDKELSEKLETDPIGSGENSTIFKEENWNGNISLELKSEAWSCCNDTLKLKYTQTKSI